MSQGFCYQFDYSPVYREERPQIHNIACVYVNRQIWFEIEPLTEMLKFGQSMVTISFGELYVDPFL